VFGLDNVVYATGGTDFIVAIPEILLQGFPVAGGPRMFRPLKESQVAIGLPATQNSAGSGFVPATTVIQALKYLTQGTAAKTGTYTLAKPAGYPNFGGVMAFSINQDVSQNNAFNGPIGQFLGTLRKGTSTVAADAN
jgi:chitinase